MSVLCFGEVLWDCLPAGLFLGGAPCNVAAHLHQLGRPVQVVSAVGDDQLGHEVRRRFAMRGLDEQFLATVPAATGTVLVSLVDGQPSYEIVDNVAWDQVPVDEPLLAAAGEAPALVFGSLALRHEANRANLQKLLSACGGLKVFDVNFRPPFVDFDLVRSLCQQVDLIKLNDDELTELLPGSDISTEIGLAAGAEALSKAFGGPQICLTAGSRGAGFWDGSTWTWAVVPPDPIRDTVGAGDSFLAATIDGLLANQPLRAVLDRAVDLATHVAMSDGATPEHPADFPHFA